MGGRRPRLAGTEERLGLGHGHAEHLADVLPTEGVLQHRRLESLPLALLAGRLDGGHHAQLGVDDAGAVAGRAGALGVGAEQRRLDAVGLRERLADRVEQSGVRRRVAPSRAADRTLVDHDDAVAAVDRAVDQRALAGAGDAGDHAEHPERDVDVHVLEVVRRGPADLHHTGRRTHRLLERGPVLEVPAGRGVAGPQCLRRCLRSRRCHHRCRRRDRGRRRGRRSRWSRACAPRRERCCPCRAAAAAGRSSARCHAGAGRSSARRRRR